MSRSPPRPPIPSPAPARAPGPPDGTAAAPWDVAVVGGGAAGLLAAIFAARAGAAVLVLETRRSLGAKIRVSGGGRCNVLPAAASLADFATSGSPRTMRNILFSWPLPAVRAFFEDDLRVPLKVEAPGKVFPVSDRSADVVAALWREAARLGVVLAAEARITAVDPFPAGPRLTAADGRQVHARRVVLACGGLSLPRSGSDGGGWRMLAAHRHRLVPPHPALVPLRTADPDLHALAGVSVPAALVAGNGAAAGELLFTHRGLSGPAGLDISRHLTDPTPGRPDVVHASLALPAAAWDAALRGGRGAVGTLLRAQLPRRLVDLVCARAEVAPDAPLATLSRARRGALVATLGALPLPVIGDEGYNKAEVTAGGIPLDALCARTLESRLVPVVHLAGEMIDVVGRLGGFNFLWAWVSGRRAGQAAAAAALSGVGNRAVEGADDRVPLDEEHVEAA